MTTAQGTAPVGAPDSSDAIDDAIISRGFDLGRAVLSEPQILDEIPWGATLVLLRDGDDPAFVDEQIAIGLRAVRQGRNVYFRHLAAGEWGTPPEGGGE